MIARDQAPIPIKFVCLRQGCAEEVVVGRICLKHYKERKPEADYVEPERNRIGWGFYDY